MKSRSEHLAVQEDDAARFVWWFSKEDGVRKGNFIPKYLQGLREGWTLDQWRAAINRAMQAEDQAEDAELHAKLEASIEAGRRQR